jgi:hypothetical protein
MPLLLCEIDGREERIVKPRQTVTPTIAFRYGSGFTVH